MPEDDPFSIHADDLQYQYFMIELTDEKINQVRIQYENQEYRFELKNGKPVVVADA